MRTRRALICEEWNSGDPAPRQVEIISLIVSTWPKHLDVVSRAILGLGNTEIHARDPKGKLIVVLEELGQEAIGAKANAISSLAHVISATMVFQATDDDSAVA